MFFTAFTTKFSILEKLVDLKRIFFVFLELHWSATWVRTVNTGKAFVRSKSKCKNIENLLIFICFCKIQCTV